MNLVEAPENAYTAASTEFIAKSMCDVLYLPSSFSTFPPIVINTNEKVDTAYFIQTTQNITLFQFVLLLELRNWAKALLNNLHSVKNSLLLEKYHVIFGQHDVYCYQRIVLSLIKTYIVH